MLPCLETSVLGVSGYYRVWRLVHRVLLCLRTVSTQGVSVTVSVGGGGGGGGVEGVVVWRSG